MMTMYEFGKNNILRLHNPQGKLVKLFKTIFGDEYRSIRKIVHHMTNATDFINLITFIYNIIRIVLLFKR